LHHDAADIGSCVVIELEYADSGPGDVRVAPLWPKFVPAAEFCTIAGEPAAIVVFIALYSMFVKTALINTYPMLIVVYTAIICGQTILFLRNFIENIPIEIEEAAAIDGCTRRQILWRIVFPLIRPGIAAIAIFIFVFVWNDFLVGVTLATTEDMRTVQTASSATSLPDSATSGACSQPSSSSPSFPYSLSSSPSNGGSSPA
jgi:hypothetical protein